MCGSHRFKRQIILSAMSLGTLTFVPAALADYAILHEFPTGTNDGEYPQDAVLYSGSSLYGITQSGAGNSNRGTIFQYNLATGKEMTDYAFAGSPDGSEPSSGLVQSGALLYGATQGGGTAQDGTLYSFNPANNTDSVLHTFTGTGSGQWPFAAPLVVGAMLYGTTAIGGNASGYGGIYGYNLTTHAESLVHAFTGGTTDGEYPY
jgi:uncharacterized repeat protein (TIGR03803 family)